MRVLLPLVVGALVLTASHPMRHLLFYRAMALTVEELRALLALVLGGSNLVLLFLNRSLAAEQTGHDKARLNLEALQKQVGG